MYILCIQGIHRLNTNRQLDSEGLTRKQRQFVNEYVIDQNQKEACIRAGYAEKSSRSAGCRLLTVPKIRAAVEDRLNQQQIASDTTVDKIVREYAWIAFTSARQFLNDDGELIPPDEWSEGMGHAVQELVFDSNGKLVRVKPWPKAAALEALSKFRGMFVDRHQVTVQVEAIDRNIIDVSPVAGNEPAPSVIEHDTEQQVTDGST